MKELKIISIEKQSDKNTASCCSAEKKNFIPETPAIKSTCCCTENSKLPEWITGAVETPVGKACKVSTGWSLSDHWGQIKSRTSGFRMKYTVEPGLYAAGNPDKDSDVLVSANYKLSFDILRRSLQELNVWILVLDTNGINVWCAAGKGTFGTNELINRVQEVQLNKIVNHNRLIAPQLGAVGVNARPVQKITGFRVYFGPVYAKDIPAYISSGYKKTEEMRTIRFTMADRLILTPMEINPALKKFPLYALIVLLIFGLKPSGIFFRDAWSGGMPFLLLGLISVFAGALVTPALLPFVPFRSFALKGWIAGMLAAFFTIQSSGIIHQGNIILLIVACLFFPLASSYIALQFTGSTTFTGMSGVNKELRAGIPVYITGVAISLILLIVFKLREWGIL